jgi:hypothetical protein
MTPLGRLFSLGPDVCKSGNIFVRCINCKHCICPRPSSWFVMSTRFREATKVRVLELSPGLHRNNYSGFQRNSPPQSRNSKSFQIAHWCPCTLLRSLQH